MSIREPAYPHFLKTTTMTQPLSSGKPILIFPAGMPRSIEYLEQCLRNGQAVIGSSSLAYDVTKERYPAWEHLPYVTDPAFKDTLLALLAEHDIAGIYTPNPVVWIYLDKLLRDAASGTSLINAWPVNEELRTYRSATKRARQLLDDRLTIASCVQAKPAATELDLSAVFRHASTIPGMCDDEKIAALCEIARHSVPGDLVEIGSAYGKSAFVLARLARLYGIGKTLCIDPWSSENLVQNDAAGLVDQAIDYYDINEIHRVFVMNLLPYGHGDVNYLRMPSNDAASHYAAPWVIHSDSFGDTEYGGKISILHIDGNHSYPAARDDIQNWSIHVAAGGWIIIDDYVWPYGDGPQRAGDEFLAANQSRISSAFVMGSALFLQLS